MKINVGEVRQCLKSFDFKTLFYEHLGWDKHQAHLDIPVDGSTVSLTAIAQKRGFVAFVCRSMLDRPTRLKIDHQVTKSVREHFVIYADEPSGQQVWHWVRREAGKPLASRDHRFDASQSGDPLIQRLERIAVSMEEEEKLTLPDMTGRGREAFDVDKVTKKFYERFKAEHAAFLKLIKGFPPPVKVDGKLEPHPDLQWYTSLMLNRLMFVYFIQKKGFLDGDTDYLRHRLAMVQQDRGKDKFQSFYRYFLLRLFHDGLGKSPDERKLDPTMEKLLGKIPYLNGGFFEVHKLETDYHEIEIPDQAFEKLFDFFEYADKANGVRWNWHLDERACRADNEINPDVVGYIFEKYINQKQMGAYYTKEDITEYISKSTIIPYLFDAARKKCAIAFKPDSALWRLLRDDPDRYIYPAVGHGVTCDYDRINHRDHMRRAAPLPLPADIEAGMKDISKRDGWNKPAPEAYALPTETWREVVARRQRCLDIRAKLSKGEVHEINDLITLNLDLWQFARDAIVNAEGPELLRAFWHAIAGRMPEKSNDKIEPGITILDPTCGSGAFLFAALRILETLYSDCLERMGRFLEDIADKPHHPKQFSDFKAVLDGIGEHLGERYFILKSIIINNLFGVDIMEEAVEICKLRLFLKLVGQVETADQIEPLPDIDFNIRAGNTLVGYTTAAEVRRAFKEESGGQGKLMLGDSAEACRRFEEQVELTDGAFQKFREMQTEHGMDASDFRDAKAELRRRLAVLDDELSRHMAKDYGIEVRFLDSSEYKPPAAERHARVAESRQSYRVRGDNAYLNWFRSHQPFHWFVHFYGIMRSGGFDAIIGNPPYVELSDIAGKYTIKSLNLTDTGNLYALCIERFSVFTRRDGRCGVIVPISSVSTPRMFSLMEHMRTVFSPLHLSHFAVRPGKLFNGVDMNLTIVLGKATSPGNQCAIWSTRYNRWNEEARHVLFATLAYAQTDIIRDLQCIPKIGTPAEATLFGLLRKHPPLSHIALSSTGDELYYHSGGRYFRKCLRNQLSNEYKRLVVPKGMGPAVLCLLTSSLYYWYWLTISDCYHVTKRDVNGLPLPSGIAEDKTFVRLAADLLKDLDANATRRVRSRASGNEQVEINFNVARSKNILDEIDVSLARHYGMRRDQTDLVISNDAKYRVRDDDE